MLTPGFNEVLWIRHTSHDHLDRYKLPASSFLVWWMWYLFFKPEIKNTGIVKQTPPAPQKKQPKKEKVHQHHVNKSSRSRCANENDIGGSNLHFGECLFKTTCVERSLHKTYSRHTDKLVSQILLPLLVPFIASACRLNYLVDLFNGEKSKERTDCEREKNMHINWNFKNYLQCIIMYHYLAITSTSRMGRNKHIFFHWFSLKKSFSFKNPPNKTCRYIRNTDSDFIPIVIALHFNFILLQFWWIFVT